MALTDIKNFRALGDRIGTSGMPTPQQVVEIAEEGYAIVVNLALPSHPEAVRDEGAIVALRGLTYVHIPVEFDRPLLSDFETFRAVMNAHRDRRVFVHCALNYRVSAFMYLYRLLEEAVPAEQARGDLEALWHPDEVWSDFIEEVLEENGWL
ncbi:MAG: protein tyrosine phosphatase family protein [Pseudomonadales bacterium]|nr:protein tyrosine phosphatase family protein [Pseudomonadales bacterium]